MDSLLENAVEALASGEPVLGDTHSHPKGNKAVKSHKRMYYGVTQLWVQVLVPPPTSCLIVENLFSLSLAFNVIICETINSNNYLKVGRVKKKSPQSI